MLKHLLHQRSSEGTFFLLNKGETLPPEGFKPKLTPMAKSDMPID